MNNDQKKDLIIGMLHALAGHFSYEFSSAQSEIYARVTNTINDIYYKVDLSKPTPRGSE